MIIGTHNTDDRVFVIAEVGNNHEGSVALAEELIGLAAAAGVDAVKFQTIVPDRLVAASETARRAQLARFQLSYDAFSHLARVARDAGVLFLSTPFDCGSVAFLDAIVPAFKVASGDSTCLPLLRSIAATGKPIICSTGHTTLGEVAAVYACIQETWRDRSLRPDLAFLHCVGAYPVPSAEANLRAIPALARAFPDCTIGYSDHTLGIEAAVAAVAIGARIIEKHFTIAHGYSTFRDHQTSADPDELRTLVAHIRTIEPMLGTGEKEFQPSEHANVIAARRSLAAARDLPAGHVLTPDDLTFLRPATGIPASAFDAVVGQTLTTAIRAGEILMASVHLTSRILA